jgi:hypothetical protein
MKKILLNSRTHPCVSVLISSHRVRAGRKKPLVVPDWWWWRGRRNVHHLRLSPQDVLRQVHRPSHVVVGALLVENMIWRVSPLSHTRQQHVAPLCRRLDALTRQIYYKVNLVTH